MKTISVQDIRTSLRRLIENTEGRELQLEHLNILGAFCATSYILGSNPLPSLRTFFPEFTWKHVDHMKAQKGLPLQNSHFIFEVFPEVGFASYVIGTSAWFDDIYGKKVFLSSKEHNPPTPQNSEEGLQRARFLVDVERAGFWCSHYQSV